MEEKNRLTTIGEGGWAFFKITFAKRPPNKSLLIKDFLNWSRPPAIAARP
jgi:hypothetical protein